MSWLTITLDLSQPPRVVAADFRQSGRPRERLPSVPEHRLIASHCRGDLVGPDGDRFTVWPGMLVVLPPGVDAWWHLPPAASWQDVRLVLGTDASHTIEPVCPSTDRFRRCADDLHDVVAAVTAQPARAAAACWRVLWELVSLPASAGTRADWPPVVHAVAERIDRDLPRLPLASELAREVGVSINHLNRLCRTHAGTTVAAWIRDERMRRAAHLLGTTSMTVAAVARAVGLPAVRAFNKAIHRHFGCAPSGLRRGEVVPDRDGV